MIKAKIYQYGYDIGQVSKQIYTPKRLKTKWGYFCEVVNGKCYGLSQFFAKKGKIVSLSPKKYSRKEVLIYLEKGCLFVKSFDLKPYETLLLSPRFLSKGLEILVKDDSFVYIFSGPPSRGRILKKSKLFNFRNQYWADVLWTMVNRAYAGKKIFFKKGNNSSFHFHCRKTETYFVHSGKLLLRFRAGKGEDRYFILNPGQAVDIPPGLIHQAGGLKDTVVIEASTCDDDADDFMVESEFTKMPKLNNN